MLGVHPNGVGSKATSRDLNVSFGPYPPDHGGIAAAAGGAWAGKIQSYSDVEKTIKEAIRVVIEEKRCAVVDTILEAI